MDLVLLIFFLSSVAEFKVYSSCPKTLIKVKGLLKFHPNGGAVRKMKTGVFLNENENYCNKGRTNISS